MNKKLIIFPISLLLSLTVNAADSEILIQAESGELSSPMVSQGSYIRTPKRGQGRAKYEISVSKEEKYKIDFLARVIGSKKEGTLSLKVNGQLLKVSGGKELKLSADQSGDFNWRSAFDVQLAKGKNKLELLQVDENIEIDALRMKPVVTPSPIPPTPSSPGNPSGPIVTAPPVVIPDNGPEHEKLLNNLIGFGQGTTGGKGGSLCRVIHLGDAGPGSLRDCASKSTPQWIVFDVSGIIQLNSDLKIQSNKTIDGRGADIIIVGGAVRVSKVENVVIHNITVTENFGEINPDAIGIIESKNVWVDHVTVGNTADGALDITKGSTNVTVSWTKLQDQNKTMLIGASPKASHAAVDVGIKVTLHHNYFVNTAQRNPMVRFGKVHIFNNVFSNWYNYAIQSVMDAQVFSQNNVFNAGSQSQGAVRTDKNDFNPRGGFFKTEGDVIFNQEAFSSVSPEKVFDPRQYYFYQAEEAGDAMAAKVISGAGRQNFPAAGF